MEQHTQTVESVAAQVRQFYLNKQTFRNYHGSTNSTRPSKHARTVDTSSLNHVLHVDPFKRTALVEPNVPMDRLVDVTLKYGLIPPVVMEFPGITVGGGYNGTSGESSSFKHGFFNETLNHVEMILANGDLINASPNENADLFYGASGACGSLGVTTLVELNLIEARKYVQTTYHPVHSIAEAVRKVEAMKDDTSLDYLDGIMFSPTLGAIIAGKMTDYEPADDRAIRTFTGPWDPWFYVHVQSLCSSSAKPITEFVPLWDYLFRYDRGGFWVGRSAFKYFSLTIPTIPSLSSPQTNKNTTFKSTTRTPEPRQLLPLVPFNTLGRWFLDDFLRTRMLYSALHSSKQSDRYIVQDLALPYPHAEEFVHWCEQETGIWPLWLCPLAAPKTAPVGTDHKEGTIHPHTPLHSQNIKDSSTLQPTLNIGLWGLPPSHISTSFTSFRTSSDSHSAWIKMNRALESKLHSLGGMKWLYAHTYYTASEFWHVYDQSWYDALRTKYGALGLPSVYEKVKRLPDEFDVIKGRMKEGAGLGDQTWKKQILDIWPIGGLYGVLKAMLGGEWKKARRSWWISIEPGTEDAGKEQ